MNAIVNAKIIKENGIIWDGSLIYDGDRITECGWTADISVPDGAEIYNAGGKYICPGFVDVHNHGGNGHWFYEEPEKAAEFFLAHGETTVFPALYSSLDFADMSRAIDVIKQSSTSGAGRIIHGLYMEGPYMNAELGSDNNYIKWKGAIDERESHGIVDKAADFVRVWCVAPEREGIEDFVKYAKSVNPKVVFSIGHSNGNPELAYKLKKYGLRNETHHCDNGTGVGPARGTKGVGPDEACLYDDDIYAELICDSQGIHVHPFMIRMVIKLKGTERIILITDGSAQTGTARPDVASAPDLCYDSEGHLSGSRLTMDMACRNLMKHTAYGLCHAIKFATINPARMAGIDDEVGSLEPGKKANILVIDDMINIERIIFEGHLWDPV